MRQEGISICWSTARRAVRLGLSRRNPGGRNSILVSPVGGRPPRTSRGVLGWEAGSRSGGAGS